MKIMNVLAVLFFSLSLLKANAQSDIPNGFKKGSIVTADGSLQSGYVKDNMRKDASVSFIPALDGKKKNYAGADLNSLEMDGVKYICIKGDFFKVLCEGELNFLQKCSDASNKPSYNGTEVIFTNGTEGRPNDYFIYSARDKQLKLISKKNVDEVIASSFAGCKEAIDKARNVNGDIYQLKDAVMVYNSRNK
jgi:hypothetical protein